MQTNGHESAHNLQHVATVIFSFFPNVYYPSGKIDAPKITSNLGPGCNSSWEPIRFFPLQTCTECKECIWPMWNIWAEWQHSLDLIVVSPCQIHKKTEYVRKQDDRQKELLGRKGAENENSQEGRRNGRDQLISQSFMDKSGKKSDFLEVQLYSNSHILTRSLQLYSAIPICYACIWKCFQILEPKETW